MNKKIVALAKNINVGKVKNDNYFLLKGIINCLDGKSVCHLLDINFNQGILVRELILERIKGDIKNNFNRCYFQLFRKLVDSFKMLTDYHKKEACSVFIYEIGSAIPSILAIKAIGIFTDSKYTNDHKRATGLMSIHWDNNLQAILKNIFENYNVGLDLAIEKLDAEYLFSKLNVIKELVEEDLEYDLNTKISRNKLYAKIRMYIPEQIESIKKTDPISYIYIMKESGGKIDESYAFNAYNNFQRSRRYLPIWFGQMGLWGVIEKIAYTKNN